MFATTSFAGSGSLATTSSGSGSLATTSSEEAFILFCNQGSISTRLDLRDSSNLESSSLIDSSFTSFVTSSVTPLADSATTSFATSSVTQLADSSKLSFLSSFMSSN